MLKRIRKWLAVIMGIFMVMEIMPVRAQYDVVFAKSLGDGTKAVFYRDTELIVEGEPVLSSIYCEGYLKISGSGKLTVKCRSGDAITAESVECSADLLIEGNKKGTGIASSYGVKFETSIAAIENVGRGIAMDNGRFENIAGVLNVDSYGDGIITNRGDIMINGLTGIDCDGSCLTTMDGGIFVNNDLYAEAHGGDPALYSKDGDISFEGGSSHITADGVCIKTGGNIFFEADVEAESAWHYAVYHCPSDTRPFVKLTAGKVRLTGDEIALRTLTDFYQEGGELTCVGGIAANADIILTGGTTRITSNGFNCIYCDTGAFQCLNKTTISNDSDNIAAVYTKSFITGTTADLIITSDETAVNTIKSGIKGKVFVSTKKGIAFQSNTFEMDGGNVTIIGDTYSIYAGSIDMKKGTLTTQNPMFAWNHDILLYGDVTAVSQDGNAITARENVIIDGRLNCVAGDDHAISADVVFFNTNANAELKANAEAVYARSFVGVHGNVIATSRDAEAIYAEGEIIAEHGSLRAIGKESALYASTKVILTHSMHVMEPENGYANGHTVYAPHHQNAPDVLIDRSMCKVILWPNNGQDWIEYYVKADDYFMLPECPFVYPPGKKFARWEYGLPGKTIHIVDDL
ncbi:MAG: hypothetical protein IKD69_06180, partial [Solobacterium sp.]|nr:hypothetical protein [Solobacterium sp.]